MKRIVALMAAFAVIAFCGDSTANAQDYQNGYKFGYKFGTGLNAAGFGVYPPAGYRGPQLANGLGHGRYDHHGGYGNFCGGNFLGGGIFTRHRLEEPPYFAKFPPVYYSHIVKRPYGTSPFAAPSGIYPVEMTVPQPLSMKNPHFQHEVAPVSDEAPLPAKKADETKDKAAWVSNPYFHQTFAFGGQ